MGSSHSIHIHVQTETKLFNPGSSILGMVNIHAESPIPERPLIVRLTCKESVSYWYGKDRFHSNKETLVVHYPIGHLECALNQGMYSIPFSIQLPSELWPSYENLGHIQFKARIEYSLDAILEGSSEAESHKTIIWVHSTLNSIVMYLPWTSSELSI